MKSKSGYLIVILTLLGHLAYGEGTEPVFSALRKSKPDTNRARLLITGKNYEFHKYYDYNSGSLRNALKHFVEARKLSIRFEQIVDDIIIDISQAVPFGPFMNEAITNAIKYAFGPAGDEVIIAFKQIGNDSLMLMVTDNGKGISEEELAKENKSLGMKMMQILRKQLYAACMLDGKSDVTITLEFQEEKLEHNNVNDYINKK